MALVKRLAVPFPIRNRNRNHNLLVLTPFRLRLGLR